MSIICGTDFSDRSDHALLAAAQLAARMGMSLHLVHCIEVGEGETNHPAIESYTSWARHHLEAKADRMRAQGAKVITHLKSGAASDTLLAMAHELSSKLVVVAAFGRKHKNSIGLGSNVDRIAQRAQAPLLVVRDASSFEAWVAGKRPLRIVLGADRSLSSKVGMDWINGLRQLGPCEVTALHLYWPPEQFKRLGLEGVRSLVDPDPEVTKSLEHEVREHLGALGDAGQLSIRSEPHLGRLGDHLAAFAEQHQADLIVVGTHQRSTAMRLWEGSVSRDVLEHARCSVVCVPNAAGAGMNVTKPVRSVLCATDFSDVGNAAIGLAYSVVDEGGTVHLAHVVKSTAHKPLEPHDIFESAAGARDYPEHDALRQRLLELMPPDTLIQDKATRLHILLSNEPALAICQAAERLDVDMLCLGTHSRSGLAKVVLGSVALEVLSRFTRPVLLARKPVE